MKSHITFCGGTGAVTGANFLFEIEKGKNATQALRVLVDCGLLQGVESADDFNTSSFPYDPASIDILFVTHAHADHIGRIPKLFKDGFKGVVYSTSATLDLSKVMLADQASLIERSALEKRTTPLYTKSDVASAIASWKTIEYHKNFSIGEDIQVFAKDAGHILGSAMFEFTRSGRKIVFTGDLGNSPSLFLRDTETVQDANYIVMESVYGDRNHASQEERRTRLKKVIERVIAEKRTLMVPVFSLERTQDMLFELNDMVETGEIPPLPVFIDSPLAIKVTDIYRHHSEIFKPEIQQRIRQGDDIFDFEKLKLSAHLRQSAEISSVPSPKIIMAGSGMSSGGRIVSREIEFLPRKDAMLLFVGYQALGTLGREIQDGAKDVVIHNQKVHIEAIVDSIDGYSSHKDSDHLTEFVDASKKTLEKVFVVMGEMKAAMFLSQKIRAESGVNAICPKLYQREEIEF